MGETDNGQLVNVSAELQRTDVETAEVIRLRAEIEATRERIRDSIGGLQDEIEETFDWKGWVADHPWQTVGAAFAIGFLLGSG